MANCQKCGADIPIGAARCEYCGAVVDLPKESPSAGTKVERGAVPGAATPCFKRVSVGMMVVFALITTGLYLSAWFFVRRGQFAGLSPKAKNARHLFGGLLGVHIFYLLAWLGYLGSPDAELFSAIEFLWWGFMGVMF
jgi:hypothetical protein